jgi:alpha-tubulin suppressor-like RCC1 family protein
MFNYIETNLVEGNNIYSCGDNSHGQALQGFASICQRGFARSPLKEFQNTQIYDIQCGKTYTLVHCDNGLYIVGKKAHTWYQESIVDDDNPKPILMMTCSPRDLIVSKSNFVLILQNNKLFGTGRNKNGEFGVEECETSEVLMRTFVNATKEESLRTIERVVCGYHQSYMLLGEYVPEVEILVTTMHRLQMRSAFTDVVIE